MKRCKAEYAAAERKDIKYKEDIKHRQAEELKKISDEAEQHSEGRRGAAREESGRTDQDCHNFNRRSSQHSQPTRSESTVR